jgi:hypothetical protein
MRGSFLAVTILASFLSNALPAQERRAAQPRSDDRVRVTASVLRPEPWFGRFRAMSGGTLTFTATDGTTQVLALTDIDRLEVNRDKRSGGRSALMGAGIGLAGAITFAAVAPCQNGVISNCHLFGAIVLGIPAALIGAIVGFFYRGERWVDVPIR